jgi:6-phosphogluconolactonase
MKNAQPISRRSLIKSAAIAGSALAAPKLFASQPLRAGPRHILVGSGTPNGILSFAWHEFSGELIPDRSLAASFSHSTWLHRTPDRYLYVASELDEFQGQPTGAVGSFKVSGMGLAPLRLAPLSLVAAHGAGTCHLTTDRTGKVVICANYAGGSAASFLPKDGVLGEAVWSEHYKGYPGGGPVPDRQEAAHAHFVSLSPDNRFVYINDLGSDKIHIYKLNTETGILTPAGTYNARPGDGPRTLHFLSYTYSTAKSGNANIPDEDPKPLPDGPVAYCVNELNSTVDVLAWNKTDGSLRSIQKVSLNPRATAPDGTKFTNTACDAVLTGDGRHAYFANRGEDFLLAFDIDPRSGTLSPLAGTPRTSCGGKTPRNFTLDPNERFMLVANQNSSNLSVFARDPKTGQLSNEGKNYPAATPMCIVFV